MENKGEIVRFLGILYINLKRSEIAYKNYIENGKKFIHARIIKKCNEDISDILIEKSYLLRDDLITDSLLLIAHFDIWFEKWNDLADKRRPDLEDEFVFENKFVFPREAASNLESAFLEMKEKME